MTLSLLFIFLFFRVRRLCRQASAETRAEIRKHVSSFLNFIFLTVSEKARSGDMCGIGPVQVQIRYWRRWKTLLCILKKKKKKKEPERKERQKERASEHIFE